MGNVTAKRPYTTSLRDLYVKALTKQEGANFVLGVNSVLLQNVGAVLSILGEYVEQDKNFRAVVAYDSDKKRFLINLKVSEPDNP